MSEHTPSWQAWRENEARLKSIQQKSREIHDLLIQIKVAHANLHQIIKTVEDRFFEFADQTYHALQPLSRDAPHLWLDESGQTQ